MTNSQNNSKQYRNVSSGVVAARCLDGPGWPLLDRRRPFFYFLDAGTLMCFDVNAKDCHVAVVDDVAWIGDLRWLFFDNERLVVVADEDTLFAVQQLLGRRSGDSEQIEAAGVGVVLLDMAYSLAASAKVVVLTTALATSWQLPDGTNPHDITLWRQAFRTGEGARSMVELFEVASSTNGAQVNETVQELFVVSLALERLAISQAVLDTDYSQIRAFRASSWISELWAAYVASDRLNIKESVVAGIAAECTVIGSSPMLAGLIRVKVMSQEFMTGGAEVVFVTDTNGIEGSLRVDNVDWDPVDGFVATFTVDPADCAGLSLFAEILSTGAFVAVTPKPDLTFSAAEELI